MKTEAATRAPASTGEKRKPRTRLKILVALDGKPAAESIFPALMPLARRVPSEFLLLKVVDRKEAEDKAIAYLQRMQAALGRHELRVAIAVDAGEPGPAILKRLESGGFDVAAMTTHGRRGLDRLLMGSVAEHVVRHARVPVILTRTQAVIGEWSRIVVPLDGSPEAESILEPVERLAKLADATVYLVHVAEVLGASGPGVEHTYSAVVAPDLTAYLKALQVRLAARGLAVEIRSMIGSPAGEAVRYAGDIGAGLIAVTTHGRTGIRRALMGSVTEQILRTAPCPVLVQPLRKKTGDTDGE